MNLYTHTTIQRPPTSSSSSSSSSSSLSSPDRLPLPRPSPPSSSSSPSSSSESSSPRLRRFFADTPSSSSSAFRFSTPFYHNTRTRRTSPSGLPCATCSHKKKQLTPLHATNSRHWNHTFSGAFFRGKPCIPFSASFNTEEKHYRAMATPPPTARHRPRFRPELSPPSSSSSSASWIPSSDESSLPSDDRFLERDPGQRKTRATIGIALTHRRKRSNIRRDHALADFPGCAIPYLELPRSTQTAAWIAPPIKN